MSDEIKSAFDLAMEKVAKLDEPSDEQKLDWKATPKGRSLAGEFMQGKGDITSGLAAVDAQERPFVIRGLVEVLTANVQLPKNEAGAQTLAKALDGIKQALGHLPVANEVAERIAYVVEQYKTYGAQQEKQAYEQLKQQFTAQVQQLMQQQPAMAKQPVNIETMPEFQQEWMRTKIRLEQQYEGHLDGYRQELLMLAKG